MEVPEKWMGALMLAGLPAEYKPMVMALESAGKDITGDFVKSKLLQEAKLGTDVQAEAHCFFTYSKPGRSSQNGRYYQNNANYRNSPRIRPKGPRCYYCNNYGHISKNCNKKIRDQ